MTKSRLIDVLSEYCNDILFSYNGKESGITSTVLNYNPTFQVWHGNETKEFNKISELLEDKFFSGKSIEELLNLVEFEIC